MSDNNEELNKQQKEILQKWTEKQEQFAKDYADSLRDMKDPKADVATELNASWNIRC